MPAKKAAKTTANKAPKQQAPEPITATADPALNSTPVAKTPTKPAKKAAKKGPTTDDIAKSAYLNYRRRVENNIPGNHESDWLEAENQFKA
jgi:hypothetical protein